MTEAERIEGRAPQPPSRKVLLLITGGGFLAAALISVLFVLPVEFHLDPTGFGSVSGLNRLAAPKTVRMEAPKAGEAAVSGTARYYPTAFRADTVDIPLETGDKGPEGSELEYKVRMKAGDSMVYSWSVSGLSNPEDFYFDFHSETPAGPGVAERKVVEYQQATGGQSNGVLVAPIPGVHGWYLQNQSTGRVVVHLKMSGFYELVPPGEYGNEGGIRPNRIQD